MPVDYESLAKLGSIMGSGGMIVMDDTSCMVDVAKFFMEFCMTESCGKCIPCRVGTAQMYDLLSSITDGRGHAGRPGNCWRSSCDMVRNTSLCGLGQTAPEPGAHHAALLPRRISRRTSSSTALPGAQMRDGHRRGRRWRA